jgi:hypothetical protein
LIDEHIEDDIKCAKTAATEYGFKYWNDKFDNYCRKDKGNLPNLQALRCKLDEVKVRPPIGTASLIFRRFEERRLNIRDRGTK